MKTDGDLNSQGAVFVFKDDVTKSLAWEDARRIKDLRAELHTDGGELLKSLSAWNQKTDPSNSFLALYAHTGARGLAATELGSIVPWADLAKALPNQVHTAWLLGCSSDDVRAAWPSPAQSPIKGTMLVTTASKLWLDVVELFKHEVSLEPSVPFDEIEALIRKLAGSDDVVYYDASEPSEWRRFLPRTRVASDIEITPERLGELLFGDLRDAIAGSE